MVAMQTFAMLSLFTKLREEVQIHVKCMFTLYTQSQSYIELFLFALSRE